MTFRPKYTRKIEKGLRIIKVNSDNGADSL